MPIDSITLEVIWSRLISIVDEMAITLKRMSFSTFVREANDYACVLFDAKGNSLAQSSLSIPSFIGCLPKTIKQMLQHFPPPTLVDGDVLITNDPWIGAGHLPDVVVVAPIYRKSTLIGFSGSIAHASDVGGRLWSADANELFEEGIRIPVMKLYRAGQLNEDLFGMMLANVRVPEQVQGDIRAQVMANETIARRLSELMDEYELKDLEEVSHEIISRSEKAMRREIKQIPDGTYRHAVHADGFESPVTLACSLTVEGSNIRVDYTGSSPQSRRGINVVPNYTFSFTLYAIKCALLPYVPNNEGCFRPVEVTAPEGTILNPRFPAAVGARHIIGHYMPYAVFGALAQVIPERVIADSGTSGYPYFGGTDEHGRKFTQFLPTSGGYGARHDKDGENCLYFPSNVSNVPVEVVEALTPLQIERKEFAIDSAGPGKFRGGCGQEFVIRVEEQTDLPPLTMSMITERTLFPPNGIAGGRAGSKRVTLLNVGETPHPKMQILFPPGSRIYNRTPGGGGYGNPLERDPMKVALDVKLGLVSILKAQEDYGVVLDPGSGEVLLKETVDLRKEMSRG